MKNRNTRQILTLLLCTVLALAAVIALPLTARAETASVSTWDGLCKALNDPLCDSVALAADILWNETPTGVCEVLKDRTVTLDLAGHTLDRGLSDGGA